MIPVRLEPAAPRSRVKYSTAEPRHTFLFMELGNNIYCVQSFNLWNLQVQIIKIIKIIIILFDLILYVQVNNLSVMSGRVFLG